jgi:hypothetical protein
LLQIFDANGDDDEDKIFWKGRNGCLYLGKIQIFMEHLQLDEGACHGTVFHGVGMVDSNYVSYFGLFHPILGFLNSH